MGKRTVQDPKPQDYNNRASWKARPNVARTIRVVLFVVPILGAIATTVLLGRAFYRPQWPLGVRLGWIASMFVAASFVSSRLNKLGNRFLPLSALCHLNLRFPKEAPSRVKMSLRIGNTAQRARVLAEFQAQGLSSDPQTAAEQVLDLIQILNSHDRKTRGHSEKVRALADVIGEQMELSDDDRNRLRWASMLHDMGKISVPAEILNKAGKPTDEEWEILKGHPGAGREKVSGVESWLGEAINCVWEHHERFDGTGYPSRLTGQQMSVFSRIVAVADSFEVMTATRSYKKPMTYDDARAELVRCSGTHFDPTVVRAFLQVGRQRTQLATGLFSSWVSHLAADGGRIGNLVRTVTQGASTGGVAAGVAAPIAKGIQIAAAPTFEYGSSLAAAVGIAPAVAKAAVAKAAITKTVATVATTIALSTSTVATTIPATSFPATAVSAVPSALALSDEESTSTTTTTTTTTSTSTTSLPATPTGTTTPPPPEPVLAEPDVLPVTPRATTAPQTLPSTTQTPTTATVTTLAVETTTSTVADVTTTTSGVVGVVDVPTTSVTATSPPTTSEPTTTTSTTTTTTTTTTTKLPPPLPATNAETPCGATGWFQEMFPNRHLMGPPVQGPAACSPVASRAWGFGSPHASMEPDYFSVRLTADVEFGTGPHSFLVGSDDGIRVWIDGELVHDSFVIQGISTKTVAVSPGQGIRRVVIEFFEESGLATLLFTLSPAVPFANGGSPIVVRDTPPVAVIPEFNIDRVADGLPFGGDQSLAVHPLTGDVYVVSPTLNRVFRLEKSNPAGPWITVAGTAGFAGFGGDGGPATAAFLNAPTAIAISEAGEIYIADSGNDRIRKVDAAGVISTISGTGFGGVSSNDNGPALGAGFVDVRDLATYGDLLVINDGGLRVRQINLATGIITTLIGTGVSGIGSEGQAPEDFSFTAIQDLTILDWRLVVVDTDRIVQLSIGANGKAHIRLGAGPSITEGARSPDSLAMGPGSVAIYWNYNAAIGRQEANILYGEANSNLVRIIHLGHETVWNIAGSRANPGSSGNGGLARSATLSNISDIAVDRANGLIYLLDDGASPTIRVLAKV
jgi:hypothetical protein